MVYMSDLKKGILSGLFLGGLIVVFFLLYASVYRSSVERLGSISTDKYNRLVKPCDEKYVLKYTDVVLTDTGCNVTFECQNEVSRVPNKNFKQHFLFKSPQECMYTDPACLPY